MSKNDNEEKTLVGKARRIKKMNEMVSLELDELIIALEDPECLHAEITGRRKEIETKLDRVLDMMLEIKKAAR